MRGSEKESRKGALISSRMGWMTCRNVMSWRMAKSNREMLLKASLTRTRPGQYYHHWHSNGIASLRPCGLLESSREDDMPCHATLRAPTFLSLHDILGQKVLFFVQMVRWQRHGSYLWDMDYRGHRGTDGEEEVSLHIDGVM
jgi:hypothetical protein